MGLQRVGHELAAEQHQQKFKIVLVSVGTHLPISGYCFANIVICVIGTNSIPVGSVLMVSSNPNHLLKAPPPYVITFRGDDLGLPHCRQTLYHLSQDFPVAQMVKNLPVIQETRV